MLEQNLISNLLEWLDRKTLVLSTDFQRRAVWPPQAKTYFIDTILRGRPVPNIYFRTSVDLKTKRSYREVVDGQQRLRTIHEFANNELILGNRAEEYKGKRYQDLDDVKKNDFLAYPIGVVQLFNADDEEVLDVFKRLNSYGLPLNAQELRRARYIGEFRWAVERTSRQWVILWDEYKVVTLRARVRMADDELVAQMFGIILDGVVDGGQLSIERLYRTYEPRFPADATEKVDCVLNYITTNLSEILQTSLARSPQFLMLFAAVAHALLGIPAGNMGNDMPSRDPRALSDVAMAKANLAVLADVIDADERGIHPRFTAFKVAVSGSTQRIRSRRIRFPMLFKALIPDAI